MVIGSFGRRKNAIARVFVKEGSGEIRINGQSLLDVRIDWLIDWLINHPNNLTHIHMLTVVVLPYGQ